jgi:hypothetical protein
MCVCVADFPHKEGVHRGEFGLDRLGFDNTLVKSARSSEASFP